MRYWAVGRSLGLSEVEFWASTMAKVCALYDVQVLDWDRRRDGFLADITAALYNRSRTKESDKVWDAEDLLLRRYPKPKAPGGVIITDPDHGAAGDWRGLKSVLKAKTDAVREQRAKLKPFNG